MIDICANWILTAQNTRRTYQTQLKKLLRAIGVSAEKLVAMPKLKYSAPRSVTAPKDEFEKVLEVADSRLRLLMLLCGDAGLRAGTAPKLKPAQINEETRTIETRDKQGAWTRIPMTERLWCEVLYAKSRAKDGETLEQAVSKNGKSMTKSYRCKALTMAKAKAGVEGNWTFHDLRRTLARKMYTMTGDLRKAQRILGHRTMSSTVWYLHDMHTEISSKEIEQALKGEIR